MRSKTNSNLKIFKSYAEDEIKLLNAANKMEFCGNMDVKTRVMDRICSQTNTNEPKLGSDDKYLSYRSLDTHV